MRKTGFMLLALIGIGFSLFMIFWSKQTPIPTPILFLPFQSPYNHYIAGEGIVESFKDNIEIGVPFPELVKEIFVTIGDVVVKGTPLFKLDTRQKEADLKTALQEYKFSQTQYKNIQTSFAYFEKLKNKSAVSQQEYSKTFYALKEAQDQMAIAFERLNQIKITIERSLILAPQDGTILQINTHIGESANVNPFDNKPLILFGDTTIYQLRVNIAEEDAWRVIKGASAIAWVRGQSTLNIPLTFHHIEPFIIPKKILTGSDAEQTDTRVLQIIYTFKPNNLPLYVGQLLDVFIEAQPSNI